MTSAYRKHLSGLSNQVAKEVSEYVLARRSDYSHAILKFALRPSDGVLQPMMAKAELIYKDVSIDLTKSAMIRQDYGDLVLASIEVSIDSFIEILSTISNYKSVVIPGSDLKLEVTQNAEYYLLNSKSNYGYGYHEWPCLYASFPFPELRTAVNYEILAKRGLPIYPDMYAAITDFLGLSSKLEHHHNLHHFIIIIPNFKARLDKVVISGKKVTLSIEAKALQLRQVIAKMYLANGRMSFQSGDLGLDSNTVTCQPEFAPEEVTACILDGNDEVLDYREHHLNWSHYNPGVVVENPSSQIEELIKRGEDENVEFKREPGNDFLESFVSFANAKGGMILLGVDNDSNIVGYDEVLDRLRDKITNKILSNVQPATIKFSLQRVEFDSTSLEGKKLAVIAITVYEGNNKPYYLRGKGILIRHGGTDSWITPSELDEIYSKRNGQNRGYLSPNI